MKWIKDTDFNVKTNAEHNVFIIESITFSFFKYKNDIYNFYCIYIIKLIS